MAYDSQSDRVILFGGWVPDVRQVAIDLNETWSYDYANNTWKNMSPPLAPPARSGHALVYDSQSDRSILFGGADGGYLSDTWEYDYNLNIWTQMKPSIFPSERCRHDMIYDSKSDRLVLFGGFSPGNPDELNDTWTYDFNNDTWTEMLPTIRPEGRESHALSYDSRMDRIILFGGWIPEQGYDDTWTYDLKNNTWTNITSSTRPSSRGGHALAYDSESDRTILFGGNSDDVWALELVPDSVPVVLATSPSDSAMYVPLDASITVKFDKAMDKSPTEGAITISPSVAWSATWKDNDTLVTFTPSEHMRASSRYSVTISKAAESADGTNMASMYPFFFTTTASPAVILSTDPADGAKDVDRNAKITITFSEPMDQLSTESAISISPGSITARSWGKENRAITLTISLEDGKRYTVTVSDSAKSASGHQLVARYQFSFVVKNGTEALDATTLMVILTTIALNAIVFTVMYLRKKKMER